LARALRSGGADDEMTLSWRSGCNIPVAASASALAQSTANHTIALGLVARARPTPRQSCEESVTTCDGDGHACDDRESELMDTGIH